MRPIRYKEEMVNEFLRDGYWTQETFFDFYTKEMQGSMVIERPWLIPNTGSHGQRPSGWPMPSP